MRIPENDGLWDLLKLDAIVDLIHDELHLDRATIRERLYLETLETGSNVCTAAREMAVTPHLFDERMTALYKQSDAFVFELFVSHGLPFSRTIDARVSTVLNDNKTKRGGCTVLCYGDGIGCDSLRLAKMGYQVTYFEFDGFSSRVAKRRFNQTGNAGNIEIIHDLESLAERKFDVVVCREVLEHVPDPVSTIQEMNRLLFPEGLAVVTESFSRVTPEFPTHLKTNLKFAGHVIPLFVRQGFRYRGDYEGHPYLFIKECLPAQSQGMVRFLRRHWLPKLNRRLKQCFGARS